MAHDGSLGLAHAYIDAVSQTGADAVKFQTHIAAAESTLDEPFRLQGVFVQDASRYAYWERTAFTEDEWTELARHARDRKLDFLSSPFSVEAIELLERAADVPAWKIASGEINNMPLLDAACATGKPVLLSSGMSGLEELDEAVGFVKDRGARLAVLQCTTSYPCPPQKLGLNMIAEFRQRYECPAGLSDHSGTVFPGLAATCFGSKVLEVHVALSRDMFGPDISSSLLTGELGELVRGLRFLETALANPIDKNAMAVDMSSLRSIFNKSIVARHALKAGTVLGKADLAFRKPGTGLPSSRAGEVVGRILKRDVPANSQISLEDLN